MDITAPTVVLTVIKITGLYKPNNNQIKIFYNCLYGEVFHNGKVYVFNSELDTKVPKPSGQMTSNGHYDYSYDKSLLALYYMFFIPDS